ncbi:hypothetical protein TWF730_000021 [Orbilia blumenaviensis]|uniref:SCP domain-containing protein n=1 Tax=Orbilia blumenaviensis TaxID=1796055 RepID=A0AAV9VRG5_9PEZI
MNLPFTTLIALLFSSITAFPSGDKDNGVVAVLDAIVQTEDVSLDVDVLKKIHGKDFSLDVDADTSLDHDSSSNTTELDKRGTKFIISTIAVPLQRDMLKYHNAWRAHHGASAVTWNSTLAMVALRSARKCVFAHTQNNKFGENIAAGTYTNPAYYAWLWYDEVRKYNFNSPGFSSQTGHFTAVVWKNTKQIGCAYVKNCAGGLPNMLFCEYSPVGNVLPASNFRTNVLPARSTPPNPAKPPPNL